MYVCIRTSKVIRSSMRIVMLNRYLQKEPSRQTGRNSEKIALATLERNESEQEEQLIRGNGKRGGAGASDIGSSENGKQKT